MLKRYWLVSLARRTVTSAVGWPRLLCPPPCLSLSLRCTFLRRVVFPLRLRRWYLPAQISLLAQVGAAFFIFC